MPQAKATTEAAGEKAVLCHERRAAVGFSLSRQCAERTATLPMKLRRSVAAGRAGHTFEAVN